MSKDSDNRMPVRHPLGPNSWAIDLFGVAVPDEYFIPLPDDIPIAEYPNRPRPAPPYEDGNRGH